MLASNLNKLVGLTIAAVFTACASSSPPKTGTSARTPTLTRDKPLKQDAIDVLAGAMDRHGSNMTDLVWAATTLDYGSVAQIAYWLSLDVGVPKPLPGSSTPFPPLFFELQEQMHVTAEDLSLAAREEDPSRVAEHYGALVQSCIQCHALYLDLPGQDVDH